MEQLAETQKQSLLTHNFLFESSPGRSIDDSIIYIEGDDDDSSSSSATTSPVSSPDHDVTFPSSILHDCSDAPQGADYAHDLRDIPTHGHYNDPHQGAHNTQGADLDMNQGADKGTQGADQGADLEANNKGGHAHQGADATATDETNNKSHDAIHTLEAEGAHKSHISTNSDHISSMTETHRNIGIGSDARQPSHIPLHPDDTNLDTNIPITPIPSNAVTVPYTPEQEEVQTEILTEADDIQALYTDSAASVSNNDMFIVSDNEQSDHEQTENENTDLAVPGSDMEDMTMDTEAIIPTESEPNTDIGERKRSHAPSRMELRKRVKVDCKQLHRRGKAAQQLTQRVKKLKRRLKKRFRLRVNDMFRKVIGITIANIKAAQKHEQINVEEGIRRHGEKAAQTVLKEYAQLDDRKIFKTVHANHLTIKQKHDALNLITLVKEKRCGKIKGRACADGRKQRRYISKEVSRRI